MLFLEQKFDVIFEIYGVCIFLIAYLLKPVSIMVAANTLTKFVLRISPLYEQGADKGHIGKYVIHWCRWVRWGVIRHSIRSRIWCAQRRAMHTPNLSRAIGLIFFWLPSQNSSLCPMYHGAFMGDYLEGCFHLFLNVIV